MSKERVGRNPLKKVSNKSSAAASVQEAVMPSDQTPQYAGPSNWLDYWKALGVQIDAKKIINPAISKLTKK